MKDRESKCKNKKEKWNKEWKKRDSRNKNRLVKLHNVYNNREEGLNKHKSK